MNIIEGNKLIKIQELKRDLVPYSPHRLNIESRWDDLFYLLEVTHLFDGTEILSVLFSMSLQNTPSPLLPLITFVEEENLLFLGTSDQLNIVNVAQERIQSVIHIRYPLFYFFVDKTRQMIVFITECSASSYDYQGNTITEYTTPDIIIGSHIENGLAVLKILNQDQTIVIDMSTGTLF